MIRAALAALALLAAGPAAAQVACANVTHADAPYTVCDVAAGAGLRLYLTGADGLPYADFRTLEIAQGPMVVAMNGGMYHFDRAPVGLYIEAGEQVMRAVPGPGPGNFGLVPNGVLCIDPQGRARVIETLAYLDEAPDCPFATQSGPMLVIDGALHPALLRDSDSLNIRNGVGTRPDGSAVLAISNAPVNFWDFATLFRDEIGVDEALFLDGRVSRLHSDQLGRSDAGRAMGPILAVPAPGAPVDGAGGAD
ncbi:MAG: phosphodiester glycosidase family protein [Paracoccaceae bacterium]